MDMAQQIIMQVARGDFVAVEQRLADHSKVFLPAGTIQATWQGFEQQFGSFVRLGNTTSVQTPQGLQQVVTCFFARASVEARIVLNGAGQVTAFSMVPDPPAILPSRQPQGRNPYQQPGQSRTQRGCLLWLALFILLLVLLAGGTWLLVQSLQTNPLFVSFFSSNYDTMRWTAYGAFLAIFVSAILAGRRWRAFPALGKVLAGVAVSMAWIVIVGALLFGSISPQISLTRTGFNTTSLDVNVGTTVIFDNPSDGVTQTLCLGRDQHCAPNTEGPPQLAPYLVLHPGQSVSITFDVWGEYHITSKTTPHMNLIISALVQQNCGKTNRSSTCGQPIPIIGIESRNGLTAPF